MKTLSVSLLWCCKKPAEAAKKILYLFKLLRATLPHLYTARRHAITSQERKQIDELIQRVEGAGV